MSKTDAMTPQEGAAQMKTAGLAGYWLHQSEMWLSELSSYGVPAEAINDLRQNARAAVHEAVEATERAALTVTPQEADPRCTKCGHPKSNHPYRHPFLALTSEDSQ